MKIGPKTLLPFAVAAALALCAPAAAQPAPAPTYSDSQMQDFARATVELQALGSQDPASMTRVIQRAGMSVEDYNNMGDAMRANPALAASLNPYLDEANAERMSRVSRAAAPERAPASPHRRVASRHTSSRHGKAHAKAHATRTHTTRTGHRTARAKRHTVAASHGAHRRHRKN